MIRAVLFDMDGVIFDSERAVLAVWREIAGELQLKGIDEVFVRCVGVNKQRTREIFGEAYPALDFDDFDQRVRTLFLSRYDKGRLPVKPGAAEILHAFSERGLPLAQEVTLREGKFIVGQDILPGTYTLKCTATSGDTYGDLYSSLGDAYSSFDSALGGLMGSLGGMMGDVINAEVEILGNYGTVLKSFEMKAGDSVRLTLEDGTALQISDGTCVLIAD